MTASTANKGESAVQLNQAARLGVAAGGALGLVMGLAGALALWLAFRSLVGSNYGILLLGPGWLILASLVGGSIVGVELIAAARRGVATRKQVGLTAVVLCMTAPVMAVVLLG